MKSDVRCRLDDIASQTFARIAVVNSPLALSTRTLPDGISVSAGWTGLETERVCKLQIAGIGDPVDLARVRLLVMLDELVRPSSLCPYSPFPSLICLLQSGLHAEACEIDHTLHAIIAGRKRSVLQTIQEETATNIYFPSPLQGVTGPEYAQPLANTSPQGPPSRSSSDVIWITGEFFGVQRARDMLFQVSLNKVIFAE